MIGALLGGLGASIGSSVANKGIESVMGGADAGPEAGFSTEQQWGKGGGPPSSMGGSIPAIGMDSLKEFGKDFGGGITKNVMNTGVEQLGDKAGRAIFGDKEATDNRRAAKRQKEAMDIQYPGTTPWERLGAGGGSSASGQSIGKIQQDTKRKEMKNQQEITDKTLENNKEVAQIHGDAQVKAAATANPNQEHMWHQQGGLYGEQTISEIKRQGFIKQLKQLEIAHKEGALAIQRKELKKRGFEAKSAQKDVKIKAKELLIKTQEAIQADDHTAMKRIHREYLELEKIANLSDKFTRAFSNIFQTFALGRFATKGLGYKEGGGQNPGTPWKPGSGPTKGPTGKSIGVGTTKPKNIPTRRWDPQRNN